MSTYILELNSLVNWLEWGIDSLRMIGMPEKMVQQNIRKTLKQIKEIEARI